MVFNLTMECTPRENSPRKKYSIEVGVLRRPSFLSEALRLPKKPDLWRTPLEKSVATLPTMSFFIHVQSSPPKDS